MHIKDAIKDLLEGNSLSDAISALLEADRDERKLQRAGDPESFFKGFMQKSRRASAPQQLTSGEWENLLEGAKLHGHYVYTLWTLGIKSHLGAIRYILAQVGGVTGQHLQTNEIAFTTMWPRPLDGLSAGRWRTYSDQAYRRYTRIVLSTKDYTNTTNISEIIKGLGLESALQNYA